MDITNVFHTFYLDYTFNEYDKVRINYYLRTWLEIMFNGPEYKCNHNSVRHVAYVLLTAVIHTSYNITNFCSLYWLHFTGSKNVSIKKQLDTKYSSLNMSIIGSIEWDMNCWTVHISLNTANICRLAHDQKWIHSKLAVTLCVVLWHTNCFQMNLITKSIRPKLLFIFLYRKLYIVTKATTIQFFLLTSPM
jgi:hypothetical protein